MKDEWLLIDNFEEILEGLCFYSPLCSGIRRKRFQQHQNEVMRQCSENIRKYNNVLDKTILTLFFFWYFENIDFKYESYKLFQNVNYSFPILSYTEKGNFAHVFLMNSLEKFFFCLFFKPLYLRNKHIDLSIFLHISKYKEGHNRPSSVNQMLLVHNHDKAENKCYTQDNSDARENPIVSIGAREK